MHDPPTGIKKEDLLSAAHTAMSALFFGCRRNIYCRHRTITLRRQGEGYTRRGNQVDSYYFSSFLLSMSIRKTCSQCEYKITQKASRYRFATLYRAYNDFIAVGVISKHNPLEKGTTNIIALKKENTSSFPSPICFFFENEEFLCLFFFFKGVPLASADVQELRAPSGQGWG